MVLVHKGPTLLRILPPKTQRTKRRRQARRAALWEAEQARAAIRTPNTITEQAPKPQ